MKSPCAEPPRHHASAGGIVLGLLGIRILFGRGDLHGAHLGDRRSGFRRTKKWGEYYRYIYIYTYVYIYITQRIDIFWRNWVGILSFYNGILQSMVYLFKKWELINIYIYCKERSAQVIGTFLDQSLKACGDSKRDTCQMPMGFTIWLYECEKDVHGRSDVSNFTIYMYVTYLLKWASPFLLYNHFIDISVELVYHTFHGDIVMVIFIQGVIIYNVGIWYVIW